MDKIIVIKSDDDIIDIRYDGAFKAVFTKETKNSRGALTNLLSALIGKKIKICSIDVNEPPINDLRDKRIRYDIACTYGNGGLVNIEITMYPDADEPFRLEYYLARHLVTQDIHGSDKHYSSLKETYQIDIYGKDSLFKDKSFLHRFKHYDEVNRISLGGRTHIITIELTKLGEIAKKEVQNMDLVERWSVYLYYLTDKSMRDKINEILRTEEGIKMATAELLGISKEQAEAIRKIHEDMYEIDQRMYATEPARVKAKLKQLQREHAKTKRKLADSEAQRMDAEAKLTEAMKLLSAHGVTIDN